MPRNVRPLGWRSKPQPLPQDGRRTQESLDAEARVRAGATTGLSFTEDGASLMDRDWVNLNKRLVFTSPSFGQLADVEENRLAAKARDEMGWPLNIMSGATKEFATRGSCGLNIRQMAAVAYDPNVHRQQTEEEWEHLDIRQSDRCRILRNIDQYAADSSAILPPSRRT